MALATATQSIELPWGAWYGDAPRRFDLPASWHVTRLAPAPRPALDDSRLAAALDRPFGAPTLTELARGASSAAVVVDDLARPTPAARLVPALLQRLNAGGLADNRITIVVATGTHGPLDERGLRAKLGAETLARCPVVQHDAQGPLTDTGILYGDQPLRLNPQFAAAQLKIAVGTVLPHSFAAYSGGAKLVLPGLADRAAVARSHKFVQLGLRGGIDVERNQFRREAEDLARRLGLRFIVCALCNEQREPTDLFCGDLVAAHRRACDAAQSNNSTPLRETPDVLMLNAYPKDVDLVQSSSALAALRRLHAPPVGEQGVVVLCAAASEGVGRHGLFLDPATPRPTKAPLRALAGQPLWIFAPSIEPPAASQVFWSGYPVFSAWNELLAALAARVPTDVRVAVLPAAPMQELIDQRP